MHNGTVADFERMRREVMNLMGEDEARWIKGNTDSEALAGVFFTYLGEETKCGSNVVHAGPMARAIDLVMLKQTLVRTITAILDTQKRVIGGGNANAPLTASDINLAITDGQQLICCRWV
jgi:glutamine amidotransferase